MKREHRSRIIIVLLGINVLLLTANLALTTHRAREFEDMHFEAISQP